jgi:hypothetical protein
MSKKVRSHDDGVRLARYRDEFEHPSVEGRWKDVYRFTLDKGDIEAVGRLYVIYSYGSHFPMYVWDETAKIWLGNSDKYSRTTSTHQSKYRPSEVAKWLLTAWRMDCLNDTLKYT